MGLFGAAQRLAKRLPLPKICHTNPTMMKLGKFIPYLKKIQEIHKSRDRVFKGCFNKYGCNFDGVSNIDHPRHS